MKHNYETVLLSGNDSNVRKDRDLNLLGSYQIFSTNEKLKESGLYRKMSITKSNVYNEDSVEEIMSGTLKSQDKPEF